MESMGLQGNRPSAPMMGQQGFSYDPRAMAADPQGFANMMQQAQSLNTPNDPRLAGQQNQGQAPYPGWNQMASGWWGNGQGGFMPPGMQAPQGTWAPPAQGYQPRNQQGISKANPMNYMANMVRPGMSRVGGNFDRSMIGRRPAY
jgi:hypothetical protein